MDYSKYMVRNTVGGIDHEASCKKFADVLMEYDLTCDKQDRIIFGAVEALFDKTPGARLNTEYIKGRVLNALNVQPKNHSELSDKVLAYLQHNSQGKTDENGVEEFPNSRFHTRKGKGGGIVRRCDYVPRAKK